MRDAFVLCVSFIFFVEAVTAQQPTASYSNETQFHFFEIEFSTNINNEIQLALLKEYSTLPNVADVTWVDAKTICLATQKAFVIEQVKPSVEKHHLSIELYKENFSSVLSSCLNKRRD
jgi:hypothetical protein